MYLTKYYQREPISIIFAFKFCDAEQKTNQSLIILYHFLQKETVIYHNSDKRFSQNFIYKIGPPK